MVVLIVTNIEIKSYNFLRIIFFFVIFAPQNKYLPGCIPSSDHNRMDGVAEKIPAYLIRIMPAKGG